MLMSSSKINYVIIKHKARVISLWGFATEYDLLSLFCWIWIKTVDPIRLS